MRHVLRRIFTYLSILHFWQKNDDVFVTVTIKLNVEYVGDVYLVFCTTSITKRRQKNLPLETMFPQAL